METKNLHATHEGNLVIGGTEIPSAVLKDGTRVLISKGFLTALGRPWKGGSRTELPNFLGAKNLIPYVSEELRDGLNPIKYKNLRGQIVKGYKAEILPLVCDVYLKARDEHKLTKNQVVVAKKADILVRALASVGIIALVDEATGYQYDRARYALEEILDRFISKDLRKWAKTFPDEFYEQMFKLRGWQYVPFSVKRPGVVGKYTNDLVYDRLAPGILEELKHITPRDARGRTKHRYFQRLTEDVGHPRLREHLTAVIALMKASTKWDQFYRMIQRALPKYGETLELPLDEKRD